MTKQLLNPEWINRLNKFNRLIVGFSGGVDSTVLLHALAAYPSFHHRLVAVHVNHGISANSPFWQDHCERFCLDKNIYFMARSAEFNRSANIEEAARIARYAIFSSISFIIF